MAKSAIEKFIKNYVRNKKVNAAPKGYEAWLRKNGYDPTEELSENVGKAHAENAKLTAELSNTLSDSGLSYSGYAKYLKSELDRKKSRSIKDAIEGYIKTDSTNKKNYLKEIERQEAIRLEEERAAEEKRLEEEKKAQENAIKEAKAAAENAAKKEAEILEKEEKFKNKLMKEVESKIKSLTTIDYNQAYTCAIEMGLDEKNAQSIAKSVTDAKRSSAINQVTEAIISKRLSMNQAKEYAKRLGLSNEDANALAEFAFKTNESVGDIVSQEDYLDYLREQINKNNQ